MSILIDLLFLLILFLFLYGGAKRGFVRSVMGFVTFIAAFLCAWQFSPPLADYYYGAFLADRVSSSVDSALSAILDSGLGSLSLENLFADKPQAFLDILERFGVPLTEAEAFYQNRLSEGAAAVRLRVSEYIGDSAAKLFAAVLAFLTVFVAVSLILWLFSLLLSVLMKLPELKTIDRVLGFLLGAVVGLLNCWVVALIIRTAAPVLSAVYPDVFPSGFFSNSVLLNLLQQFNPFELIPVNWIG